MPALTISTSTNPPPRHRSRTPSPARPPVSPITPTLGPTRTLAHAQPDQTAIPPPAPAPLAFDANPDVIAIKSAISILQIQKNRATADIQALSRAKDAAVVEPEAFLRDLVDGKINAPQPERDDSSDEDDDMDNAGEGSSKQPLQDQSREWTTLPTPQNVVRCPPINWSQYAIVGDSLDKLHAEQVSRPIQGTPATIGQGGMYEFKGGDGKQETYPGIAAPYHPLQDKVDKKGRGKR